MSILGEKGYNYKTKESVQMDVGVQFDDNVMKFLNPYDANELVDFNPGYLAGFFADTYDENINKITDNSKKIAGKRIYNKQ